MEDAVHFLITVLQTVEKQSFLVECAMTLHQSETDLDLRRHMGVDVRDYIFDMLPPHVQSIGPIVDVKPIFDIIYR